MRIYCTELEAKELLEEVVRTIPDGKMGRSELLIYSEELGTITYWKYFDGGYIVDIYGIVADYISHFKKLNEIK